MRCSKKWSALDIFWRESWLDFCWQVMREREESKFTFRLLTWLLSSWVILTLMRWGSGEQCTEGLLILRLLWTFSVASQACEYYLPWVPLSLPTTGLGSFFNLNVTSRSKDGILGSKHVKQGGIHCPYVPRALARVLESADGKVTISFTLTNGLGAFSLLCVLLVPWHQNESEFLSYCLKI